MPKGYIKTAGGTPMEIIDNTARTGVEDLKKAQEETNARFDDLTALHVTENADGTIVIGGNVIGPTVQLDAINNTLAQHQTAIGSRANVSLSNLDTEGESRFTNINNEIATTKQSVTELIELLQQVRDALAEGRIDDVINLLDTFLLGENGGRLR